MSGPASPDTKRRRQASTYSGAADEELSAQRIAAQESELEALNMSDATAADGTLGTSAS
jgi:hypothetical protein